MEFAFAIVGFLVLLPTALVVCFYLGLFGVAVIGAVAGEKKGSK